MEKWDKSSPSEQSRRLIGNCHAEAGVAWMEMGDVSRAIDSFQKSMQIREQLVRSQPGNVIYQRDLLSVYVFTGDAFAGTAYVNLGEPAAAMEYYLKAQQLASKLVREDSRNALAIRDAANVERKLGNQWRDSDPKRAAESFRRSMALVEQLLERDAKNTDWLRLKGLALMSLGYAQGRSGDNAAAVHILDTAVKLQRDLIARDAARAGIRQDLQASLNYLGDIRLSAGEADRALQHYQQSLEIAQELNRRNPADLYSLFCLATSYERVGAFHTWRARRSRNALDWAKASEWLNKSLAVWQDWSQHGANSAFNQRRQQAVSAALAEVSQAWKGARP